MPHTAQERGQQAVADFLAKLSGDARTNAEAIFASSPDAVAALGDRVLRDEQALAANRADLARREQVNDAFRSKLEIWQAEERQRLDAERAALARPVEDPPVPDPNPTPSPADARNRPVTVADLEERERIYAVVTAQLAELSVAHYAEFGERLDIQSMLRDPDIAASGGVLGVYQKKFGDQLQAKADQRAEQEREKLREEGRQQARAEAGKSWPMPSAYQGDEEQSGLSGLSRTDEQKAAKAASGDVIDRAAAMYNDLLQQKAARAH